MAQPTLARIDSFEHGLVGTGNAGPYNTVTGTPTITTSTPRTGARCLEISAAGAAEHVRVAVPASTRVCADAFYVRFVSALPGADVTLFHYINANGNGLLKYDNATGRFAVVAGASGDTPFGPATLAADTLYRVVLEYDTSTGTATMKATIDNGTEGQATNAQTAADISSCGPGTPTTHTYTARYDDWIGSNTDGDYELLKAATEHQVEALLPTADGTHSISGANEIERNGTGTDITNATTDAYTLIDDVPMDLTPTDYVNDVGTNAASYVEVTLGNLAATALVPADVRALFVDRDSTGTGASSARAWLLLSDNTEVAPDLRLTSDDPGVTVTLRNKVLTRPTGDWDRTKVDGLKARMGLGDGAPDVWFASLMVEVAVLTAATQTLERSAAVGATAAIAAAPQRAILRALVVGSTAGVAAVPQRALLRSTALAAAATVAAAAVRVAVRSLAIDATASLTAAHQRYLLRQLAVGATAALAATPQRDVLRSLAVGATAAVVTDSERTILRSLEVSGTAAIVTDSERYLLRSALLAATATVVVAGQPVRDGSAALAATAAITAAPQRDLQRALAVGAAASVAAAAQRDILRSASVGGTVSVAVAATSFSVLARALALGAVGTVSAGHQRELLRSATVAAAAAISAAQVRDVHRSLAVDTTAAIESAGGSNNVTQRAASLGAAVGLVVAAQRDIMRSLGVGAAAAASVAGESAVIRSASVAAVAQVATAAVREMQRASSVGAAAAIGAGYARELMRSAGLQGEALLQAAAVAIGQNAGVPVPSTTTVGREEPYSTTATGSTGSTTATGTPYATTIEE